MRVQLSVLSAVLLLSVGTAEIPHTLSPAMTARYPVVTVPLGKTPGIDGKVYKGEYGRLTRLQDLVTVSGEDKGTAGWHPTTVVLTYTAAALYVGFSCEMPEGARPAITATQGRDQGFTDDAFEIILVPGDRDGEQFHLGGNAAGVTWERDLSQGADNWANWNPQIRYATFIEEGSWGGEFEIPWSELGAECPGPGDVWRANFFANRRTPSPRLEAWSYWHTWRDGEGNGRLIFGGDSRPYFTFSAGWKDAWLPHRRGMFPNIQTPLGNKDPRTIEILYQFLRRDLHPEGEGAFHTELHTLRQKATAEGTAMPTFEQDLQALLKTFRAIDDIAITRVLPDPDFTVGWGPTYKIDQAGDYLFRYHFKDVTHPDQPFVIAGGAMPFRIRSGIQASVTPFLLTRGAVVITADLRAVADRREAKRLRAAVLGMDDDRPLAETVAAYAGEKKQDVEVPVRELPVDRDYRVQVQLLDASGRALSQAWAAFRRPADPDWWVHRDAYGLQPEVPWPWTPIQWKEGAAQVWGRTLFFGPSLLPQQIENQGIALLAAPIRLALHAQGKLQPWERRGPVRATAVRPGNVRLESDDQAAGVRVQGTLLLEFDGFSTVDLELEPAGPPVPIDSLELILLIRAECAQFLTNYCNAPGPGKQVARYVGKTPNRYTSPVMITTWLGTDDLGLEWSAESSRDWSLARPDEAIQVEKTPEGVEARFHFIDAPITLDRRRHIRFGLVATPVKPVPSHRRNWRIDFASGPPPIPGETQVEKAPNSQDLVTATEQHLLEHWKDRAGIDVHVALLPINWSGYDAWHPRVRDLPRAAIIREQERLLKEHGHWVLRNGGWAVAPYAPDWDPWGKEMVREPKEPTFSNQLTHSYASPFVEFFAGSWAMHARELGVRGIRFDTVFPWSSSENPYLGEAWTSDDGKTYGSQNLFRQREMVKRLYRIFHGGEVEEGIIYHPLAGPPILAVESFVDIHEVGEGFYMKAKSLKEGYVQDQMRVWMTSKAYGFVEVNSIKGGPLTPNHRIGALLAAGAAPRLFKRACCDIRTYETREWYMPASAIWSAWSWIDKASAEWHPHWKNGEEIATTASGRGEHYVSFHLQPGRRILLVAANYEPIAQDITVELKPAALGFSPGVKLEGQDAVTGEAVEIQGGTLTLSCGPELYRYVRIGPRQELNGPNLDPLH